LITVLGRVDESGIHELGSIVSEGDIDKLSEAASRIARATRTIDFEPPVTTGSMIPAHAEIPVHYLPAGGRWLKAGGLVRESHPSAAYAIAGHWGLRLGPPVGVTPTGHLVFQPLDLDDIRLTIERPVSQPVGPKLNEARAGIYRYDGLGGWHQTATVLQPEELRMVVASRAPALAPRALVPRA
jgi:hypothetical protein